MSDYPSSAPFPRTDLALELAQPYLKSGKLPRGLRVHTRQHGAVEEDIFDFSPFHVGSASCPVSLSLREVGHWTTTFSSPSRSLRSASREGCIIQYPLDCFRISW